MKIQKKATVSSDAHSELIPGLPYTNEEKIAAICRAEEDYANGRYKTSEEIRAKHTKR